MSSPYMRFCQQLDQAVVRAGQSLLVQNAITECQVLHEQGVVSGTVANGSGVCRVYIQLANAEGECSCEQETNCAHVAALLLCADQRGAVGREYITPVAAKPLNAAVQRQCLVYRLSPGPAQNTALAMSLDCILSVFIQNHSAEGSALTPFNFSIVNGDYPRYVNQQDQNILRRLRIQEGNSVVLDETGVGGNVAEIIQDCLQSGRAYWDEQANANNNADNIEFLHQGPALKPAFSWQINAQGDQQLRCVGPNARIVPATIFCLYVEPDSRRWGKVEYSRPRALLQLKQSPAISPEQVEELILPQSDWPKPHTLPVKKCRQGSAEAHIVFAMQGEKPSACPWFAYQGRYLEYDQGGSDLRFHHEGVVYHIGRDQSAESFFVRLWRETLERHDVGWQVHGQRVGFNHWRQWLQLQHRVMPLLVEQGFVAQYRDDFPYRLLDVQHWYGQLSKQTRKTSNQPAINNQWFDFELGVKADEAYFNLLPEFVALLRQQDIDAVLAGDLPDNLLIDKHIIFNPSEGRYLLVSLQKVQGIVRHLVELVEQRNTDNGFSLNRSNALNLHEFVPLLSADGEQSMQWRGELSSLRIGEALANNTRIPLCELSNTIRARLRPYQHQGVSWLGFLAEHQLGGVLADDMGLGKTLQALSHIAMQREKHGGPDPALVVAPTSVLTNWRREASKFTPGLKVLTWHGIDRRHWQQRMGEYDLVLTTYAILQRDQTLFLPQTFSIVILDEAQMIKNPRAKVSQVARKLQARQRLALSGTPVENHLGELWSLFDFVLPGLLGGEQQFKRLFRKPIENNNSEYRGRILARRVAPFILRRKKDRVARQLPAKTEIVTSLPFTEEQQTLYDSMRLSMHRDLQSIIARQGPGQSQLAVLDALLRLRQICCDPRLLQRENSKHIPSAKLNYLSEQLPQLVEAGRRVLLFSQFTGMLDLIAAQLDRLGVDYLTLTGKSRNRQTLVDRFQGGAAPVFLISLKAGGTGLNLTAADTVIHYDPWWNPAVENQATDRAHRIGQDKPVFVYKWLMDNSVEEKILALHQRKYSLAEGVYTTNADSPLVFQTDDIDYLFS